MIGVTAGTQDRSRSTWMLILLASLVVGFPVFSLRASDDQLVQIADQIREAEKEQESYRSPTQPDLLNAIAGFQAELYQFENFMSLQPAWRSFLRWDDCRAMKFGSFSNTEVFAAVALRWFHAGEALDDKRFFAIHNRILEIERVYLQLISRENTESRTVRAASLQKLLQAYLSDPSSEHRSKLLVKCTECKRFGQFIPWMESLESKLIFPNVIVRIPSELVIEESRRPLAEPFTTTGVFDSVRTSSSGNLIGTVGLRPRATADGIGLSLGMQGELISRSTGQSSQVSLRSTARSNLSATKQIVFRGWGVVSTEPTQISGRTSIQYDQVVPRVGRFGRQAVLNAVNSNKAGAERQAQQDAESWVRKRMDAFASLPEFASLNSDILSLRDFLFRLERTKTQLKCRTTETEIDLSLTCVHDDFRGAPSAPPVVFAAPAFSVAIHETFLGRLLAAKYRGRTVALSGILQGSESFFVEDQRSNELESGFADGVTFSKTKPIAIELLDSGVRIQANLDRVSTEGTSLEGVRIERRFAVTLDGDRLRLVPQVEVVAVPIGFDSRTDKLGQRKRASFRAIERRLEESTKTDSVWMLDLGLRPKGSSENSKRAFEPKEIAISDGWLQIRYGK